MSSFKQILSPLQISLGRNSVTPRVTTACLYLSVGLPGSTRTSHDGMHAATSTWCARIGVPGARVHQQCCRQTHALPQGVQSCLRSGCSSPVQECFLSTWQLLLLESAPHALNWPWGYLAPANCPKSPPKTSSKRQGLYLLLEVLPVDGEAAVSGM